MGLRLQDMADLPDEILQLSWADLERCLLESTRFVDNILKPVLSKPQYGRKLGPIYHSEMMIISMIATAFPSEILVNAIFLKTTGLAS